MTATPKHAVRVVREILALAVREKAARTVYDSARLLVEMTNERLPANWDDDILSEEDHIEVLDALKDIVGAQNVMIKAQDRLIRVARQLAAFDEYAISHGINGEIRAA